MNKLQRIEIATIIIVALLAFGLQIPLLGFFQDDWNFVFYSSVHGIRGLFEFATADGRPGASWVYGLGFAVLGYKPALWQFFTLLLSVLTTISGLVILNNLWPKRKYGNLIASVFFLTYPFYTLQPLAVTYSAHWMAYLLYALSVFLMIRAIQKPEKYLLYTVPAIFFTFIHLFTEEYFVGLELLRPFIAWFVLSTRESLSLSNRSKKTLLVWLPYLLILIFFVLWRSLVLSKTALQNDPLATLNDSGQSLLTVASNVIADWVLMFISSWFNLIDPKLFVIGPIRNFYFIASTVIGALVFYWLSKRASQGDEESSELKGIMLAGILIFVTGMLSAYSVGYVVHLKTTPWNSRFVLPAMLGLALMSSAVIEMIITSSKIRQVVLVIIIGLLIGWHNYNTLSFKDAWEKQTRFYEQLMWRAPSMKPGTPIIANEEILGYMGEYPTSFGINTMYETKQLTNVPLWFFVLSGNYSSAASHAPSGDELIAHKATTTFIGKKANALYITYQPDNKQCLWVLRSEDADYKYLPAELKAGIQSSDNTAIQPEEREYILYHQIVKENKNTWCYFFQKAELARQIGDSQEVADLWQEAQAKGFHPGNGFEYIPFIEGFARLGKWEQAYALTKTANKFTKGMYFILCPTWKRLDQETSFSSEKESYLNKAYDILGCNSN